MTNFFQYREWMDRRIDPERNCISAEFEEGINAFIQFACSQPFYGERGTILCPCARCKNTKQRDVKTVSTHLFVRGFKSNYYLWTSHGENSYEVGESSRASGFVGDQETWYDNVINTQVPISSYINATDSYVSMEDDVMPNSVDQNLLETIPDEPCYDNAYQSFDDANQPIYESCPDGITQLSMAARLLKMKTDHNLAEVCVDEIAQLFRDVLPSPNKAPGSYYELKKLTRALGMPVHKIDVCEDNCMLFWKGEDQELMKCRFCKKDRYHPNVGTGKNIPKQRMYYLPIGDRLKRLYQSNTTASHMRWHAEHNSPVGEMHHPSDGKAWKHFQMVFPEFARESRNIYLGLSTDGFNPIGLNGEAQSVWPVIVTPYNLPPGMCMKREYLFLSILVPGPKHPKKSLDIYLQPLIEELQSLWRDGIDAYDVSRNQNFKMRVALMWTISDFPAYGMLSGWSTHGRLSCPYCLDETKSFWLTNARKHSWFDCHRMFLPANHPYRRNVIAFRRGKAMTDNPPPWLTGAEILYERIDSIEGLSRTVSCGGNGHNNPGRTICGFGDYHNWVKRSIFWELPYWEHLLLRHNLDFMHIEKNFFDNIINTVLNAAGRTKDTVKSRLDLPDICRRRDLELTADGHAPVPIFRLSIEGKKSFLMWLKKDIKFPDGFASNFSRCVDENQWKLSGLKSHDCHVIMQRLLPFAFSELLPKNVNTTISEIALFFRDISSKHLRTEDVAVMKDNIAVKLCNLEKIFPPSFFDVMEHLPVHLPDEAALGGPVQYRWMYPFERYMFHLKKKCKNKARIGGSIVAQCVMEEISYASTTHFQSDVVEESSDRPGEFRFMYAYGDVPILFNQEGRLSGKSVCGWLTDEDFTILQTFMLLNCEAFAPYERMFEEYMRENCPDITTDALQKSKDKDLAEWCKDYINKAVESFTFPLWMVEFVQGPRRKFTSWPIYYTRGYCFHTISHGEKRRVTQNYGVCVRGTTETEYYGIIEDIIMIEYNGAVGLKSMIFKCKWFDTREGRGVRRHPSGLVDVAPRRQYQKYDPFILSDQCDQVCYTPYPCVRRRNTTDEWWACTKVLPRGIRENTNVGQVALQDDTHNQVVTATTIMRVESHAILNSSDYDDVQLDIANEEELRDGECDSEAEATSESE